MNRTTIDHALPPVRVYWEPNGLQRTVKRIELQKAVA